ncbi:flagellar type III secretion system pore protein FliP [Novosphingobium sp.]|uniref:flagellar type III secretion system pore protein FliP n=1 Tax=Novosphingobium sp. TaxID=1874826 RepID=UPI00262A8677|nr:flagellar type III secretion system pore protein FliP [Novosphingobium sp.]
MKRLVSAVTTALVLLPHHAFAAVAQAPAPEPAALSGALDRAFGQMAGAQSGGSLSLSLQLLLIMGLLTILPTLVLMMTSFTRVLIVLSILRQAMGLQQSPPNQVLIGLSLFLSLFIMGPTLDKVNANAIQPYASGQIGAEQAFAAGGREFHSFMIRQTRETDLRMFADMAKAPRFASTAEVPYSILLPAFVTSELKTAFQIGFMLFLPFLVIDLVVSSVLMSLGMMMMSPTIVSLPFKLLLFVLVDGWALLMGSLAASFG